MSVRRVFSRLLGLVAVLVIAAAACLAALIYMQGHPTRSDTPAMVALGSSYAAGPGLGARAPGSLFLCAQSVRNYPHLVAEQRSLLLADATCSGATTANILEGGQYWQPPQIAAVNANTKLVTITVGGNDVFYISNLAASACANHPREIPWFNRLLFCGKPHSDFAVNVAMAHLGGRLSRLFSRVRARAPSARILVVNYLTLLPESGTCDRLGLTDADADKGRRIATALSRITATAARHNAELIDAASISRGHDACASTPWVQGFVAGEGGGAPFHPNRAGTDAVARLVLAALASPGKR